MTIDFDDWTPTDDDAPDAPPRKPRKPRGALRVVAEAEDARPLVLLTPYSERAIADTVVGALAANEPNLYQRAGMMVRVVREPATLDGPVTATPPRILPMTRPVLREHIDSHVRLAEPRKAEPKPCHPPDWLVALVEARSQWDGVRRLEMVTQCPVMRPDGTVLDSPGYDMATGLLYEPNFEQLEVPAVPRREHALEALAELRDVVVDFPFAAPKHEAGYLALLLTPFARFAFRGPSPLGVIDGSVAGVGKGKLVQVISMLVDGCQVSPTPQPEEPEEERKLITSIAISGRRMVMIDNVTRQVGSGPLEALLTSTRWNDRVLGSSKTFDGDVLTQWFVTGNNVGFRKKDTIRRCVHVRIEAKTATPEERTSFAHSPLLDWVQSERPRLVRAALTILRAHALADWYNPCASQWGSFEGWSDRVRSALVWLGCDDPADTRLDLNATADTEGTALVVLLEKLHRAAILGSAGLSARDLMSEASTDTELKDALDELCPTRKGDPTARQMGYALRSVKGRVVEVGQREMALEAVPGPGHTTLWTAKAQDRAEALDF